MKTDKEQLYELFDSIDKIDNEFEKKLDDLNKEKRKKLDSLLETKHDLKKRCGLLKVFYAITQWSIKKHTTEK